MSRIPTFKRPSVGNFKRENITPWKRFLKKQAWVKCRASYLKRHPACVVCMERDELVPATEVHHTKGQDMEHAFNEDTFMALCKPCHSRITMREQVLNPTGQRSLISPLV